MMNRTLLIKPEMLVPGMDVIGPGGQRQRVIDVQPAHDVEGEIIVVVRAKPGQHPDSADQVRLSVHSHEYARISARIPAHVRAEVLAKAGVTGDYMYKTEHADKPARYRFTWIPREMQRYGGYGDQALSYGMLKRMSDFALTGGVPQA